MNLNKRCPQKLTDLSFYQTNSLHILVQTNSDEKLFVKSGRTVFLGNANLLRKSLVFPVFLFSQDKTFVGALTIKRRKLSLFERLI